MNSNYFSRGAAFKAFIAFACLLSLTPFYAFASVQKPECTLSITTPQGSVETHLKKEVALEKGKEIRIVWSSENATKAVDQNKDKIGLYGTTTSSSTKNRTYSYTFTGNGGKKATCTVNVHVIDGSITSSLQTNSQKPTIAGKATGAKTVQVKLYEQGSTKAIYTSGVSKVKSGKWSVKVTKKLKDGVYDVIVQGEKGVALNTITQGELAVGEKAAAENATTVAVVPVPLLIGGVVHLGGLVPISYLQVVNIGTKDALLKGFTIKQNGSAPAEAIMSLSTVDDTGLLRSSVDGVAGKTLFKNGIAFIPTEAILTPGAMHLFTLKAAVAPSASVYVGKQLSIDVTGVTVNAGIQGTFPIRGTTWIIAY